MDMPVGSEDPAILRLHKWDPSEIQLNLSEFREAFLSPSREILLLHSYQKEALLLPLVKDELHSSGRESGYDYNNHNTGSSTLCSQAFARSSGSGLVNDLPCTSGSDIDFDNDPAENKCSRYNSYPFISEVNSLAWALCGYSYDEHSNDSFRELLFVSGRCGVTVHAFPNLNKARGMVQAALEGHYRQGRWAEWGPASTSAQNVEVGEASGDQNVNWAGGIDKVESSGVSASKRYLESFFTKVETTISDGSVWTKFPDNREFPCSAEVVSFKIFDGVPPLDYPFKEKSVRCVEDCQELVDLVEAPGNSTMSFCGADTTADILSNVFGVEINGFYECPRVFSSASYYMVGFFLTLIHHVSTNVSDVNNRGRSRNFVLIARLDSWGIQWVSVLKPDEIINTDLAAQWMDFQFSDNHLVCLNSSGLIVLYASVSGEFVTSLNVSQACGLNPHLDLKGFKTLSVSDDIDIKQDCDSKVNFSDQQGVCFRKSFKRVVVASHTSLLAVVDEYGVIYVISLGDYVSDKNYSYEKLFPYCQQFWLGMLVGWGVGGSHIDRQMVCSIISGYFHGYDLSKSNGSVLDKAAGNVLQKCEGCTSKNKVDLCGSSGFSAASKVIKDPKISGSESDAESLVMRKIFLPNFRVCDDDSICFSPLGVTLLYKMEHVKNQKSSQFVHFNLQVKLDVHDDNFLHSGYGQYHLNGKEETVIGQAIGCTFQGHFYIVREDGLSVYLPSISVSSNFLPVEYTGYHKLDEDVGISVLVKGNMGIKESIKRFSPWKVEILDRVLLYEGTKGADHLCLENGFATCYYAFRGFHACCFMCLSSGAMWFVCQHDAC